MLQKVELLVGGRGPEIITLVTLALFRGPAVLANNGDAAFLAERRIGEHQLEALLGVGRERVAHHDRLILRAADAVQEHVHGAKARHARHQLAALEGVLLELFLLGAGEVFVVGNDIVVRGEQEAARAAGRVADLLAGLGRHGINDGADERPRGEVLPRSLGRLHGVFVEEPLVGIALDVRAHARPVLLVDEIDDQPTKLGRVLELVLGLAKDKAEQSLLTAQGFEDVAVVIEKLVTVALDETLPGVLVMDDAFLLVRLLGALVRHLEEEQIGELLDVIAVAHAVVAKDVAVVPEFLDDGGGIHNQYMVSTNVPVRKEPEHLLPYWSLCLFNFVPLFFLVNFFPQ